MNLVVQVRGQTFRRPYSPADAPETAAGLLAVLPEAERRGIAVRITVEDANVVWLIYPQHVAAEEEDDPPLPPCEQPVPPGGQHPRFPSGWCVVCGAAPEEGCRRQPPSGEDA